ncbi:MAG: hypothetical protein GTO24_26380 [candidate division Zixibacteria bacterium]|nr:hypothetical protein [candidate division Zixibacteria bacterium]
MQRYPSITAHIIAESLGYATPTKAAIIGWHAMNNEPDYCEWLDACYRGDARRCLQDSIRKRHYHHGYMAEYKLAKKLVERALETGDEPFLASWF